MQDRNNYILDDVKRAWEESKQLELPLNDKPAKTQGKNKWTCPIDHDGCTRNCGNYGCGN